MPGLTAEQFKETADKAKAACLITRALSGVDEITLEANLKG